MGRRSEVTALLNEAGRGNTDPVPRVLPLVYDELCVLARRHRFRWRDARSPGTGSLVHEAYLKLVDQSQVSWESRAQFFTIASRVMRSILGLTVEESTEALGISPVTVKRGWTTARAWLYQQLTEGAGPAPAGASE